MEIAVEPEKLAATASDAAATSAKLLSLAGSLEAAIVTILPVLADPEVTDALDNLRHVYRNNLAELALRTEQISRVLADAALQYSEADSHSAATFTETV